MKRFLILFPCSLIILAVAVLAYGYWLSQRAHPLTEGKLRVHGLQSPVEIVRDSIGVPHIFAKSFDDAIFAQGFVTAQDRLWQMDVLRRLGYGELSEVLGERALESDKENRVLGFKRMVNKQERTLLAEDRHCLERYAEGVNAFIHLNQNRLPIEFHILQYRPILWSARDTLVLNLWMGKLLTTSWETDLMRELINQKLNPDIAKKLLVEYSPDDVLVAGNDDTPLSQEKPLISARYADHPPPHPAVGHPLPQWGRGSYPLGFPPCQGGTKRRVSPRPAAGRWAGGEGDCHSMMSSWGPVPLTLAELRYLAALSNPAETWDLAGSNNWAVAGARSFGGKPLLANDPHLPNGVPCIWYMAHLIVPGAVNVIGVTIPGAPGIILGHNENIGWSATNSGADVQDLYVEELHPQDRNRYRVGDSWLAVEEHEEVIRIRGRNPEVIRVRNTRHGPVIRELGDKVLSLRWTLLDERISMPIPGRLNRASDWDEFLVAMESYWGPVQNFVYADREGNIGFLNAGKIPLRARGDGSVPVPGETDDYEWIGFIPFDQLPRSFNPPSGTIVTANNRVAGRSYPHFITHQWASPHRARRIQQLLESRHHPKAADMLQIQGDVYSSIHKIISRRIIEAIDSVDTSNAHQTEFARVRTALENWDFEAEVDSIGTSLCEEFRRTLLDEVLKDKLGEEWKVYSWFSSDTFVENLLRTKDHTFLPEEYSSFEAFVLACLKKSLENLNSRYKTPDLNQWRWGEYLPVRFRHPLGQFWPLTPLFNTGPYPQPGTPLTVRRSSASHGVSMRMVVDFSDFDQSLNGITL